MSSITYDHYFDDAFVEINKRLGKNIVMSTGKRNSRKQWQGRNAHYAQYARAYCKKIENSSIDLLRGRNSWSKSCKFHCFINFADKKASKTPSNRALRGAQTAPIGILDAKIFSGEAPRNPPTTGDTPSRAFPHSRLRRSCTPLACVIQKKSWLRPCG